MQNPHGSPSCSFYTSLSGSRTPPEYTQGRSNEGDDILSCKSLTLFSPPLRYQSNSTSSFEDSFPREYKRWVKPGQKVPGRLWRGMEEADSIALLPTSQSQNSISRSDEEQGTNYVSIKRNSGIDNPTSYRGKIIINPYLRPPLQFAGQYESTPGVRRKNLHIEVENGGIAAVVTIQGSSKLASSGTPTPADKNPVTIDLRLITDSETSTNTSPLVAKILASNDCRALHITMSSSSPRTPIENSKSPISLYLPRSFHGTITVYTRAPNLLARISLSHGIHDHVVVQNESAYSQEYYLKNARGNRRGEDRVHIELGSGTLRLQFFDEYNRWLAQKLASFLGSLCFDIFCCPVWFPCATAEACGCLEKDEDVQNPPFTRQALSDLWDEVC